MVNYQFWSFNKRRGCCWLFSTI